MRQCTKTNAGSSQKWGLVARRHKAQCAEVADLKKRDSVMKIPAVSKENSLRDG